jgi:hypothetical protein
MSKDEVTRSALVVLRPARGPLPADAEVTSGNVQAVLPDPTGVTAVTTWFAAQGFEVEAPFGLSFSIAGPPALFDRVFGAAEPGPVTHLPLDAVPPDVRRSIETVQIGPPPDFGPTQYMP